MKTPKRIRTLRPITLTSTHIIPAGTIGEVRRSAHSREVGREILFATVATEHEEVVLFEEEVEYLSE